MALDRMLAFAGHQIRRCHQLAVALFMEELAAADVTPLQYAALSAIAETPDLDATRLASLVAFDRSTLGNVLERLERRDLIARDYRSDDRRTKRLSLTENGRRFLATIEPAVARSQQRFIDVLSPDDQRELRRILNALIAAHADDEARYESNGS